MKTVTLSIAPESADKITDGWQVARQQDFRGGESLALLDNMIGRNQLIRMENAILSPEGQITEAWQMDVPLFINVTTGIVVVPISDSPLFTVYAASGANVVSFTFDPANLTPYDLADPSGYPGYVLHTPVSPTTISGITHGTPFLGKNFCCAGGEIYNLSDSVLITGGALAGKTPIKLRQYDNRLWAPCSDGSLVFSDNGDATTWDPLNIILAPNHEPIIDFQPVQGGAILITRTSVYAFYGSGTYQDTSILLIQDRLRLSDSAVQVDNVVYALGNRGVNVVTLNGIKEAPHDQTAYFAANYAAWNSLSVAVQGIYLYRFHAILYLFQTNYGAQGFVYSLHSGAFQKISQSLPAALPYMVELADAKTDFLLGHGDGTVICRSIYPAGVLSEFKTSNLQFRHEDADSTREKIWRHLGIAVEVATYNVMLQVFLNNSAVPTIIKNGVIDLLPGDNIIDLFDDQDRFLRGRSISIGLTIGGSDYLTTDPTDDGLVELLTTEPGEPLIDDTLTLEPSNFAIREIRLKYCEVGPSA